MYFRRKIPCLSSCLQQWNARRGGPEQICSSYAVAAFIQILYSYACVCNFKNQFDYFCISAANCTARWWLESNNFQEVSPHEHLLGMLCSAPVCLGRKNIRKWKTCKSFCSLNVVQMTDVPWFAFFLKNLFLYKQGHIFPFPVAYFMWPILSD